MGEFVLSGTFEVDAGQGVAALQKAEAAVVSLVNTANGGAPGMDALGGEIEKTGSAAEGAADELAKADTAAANVGKSAAGAAAGVDALGQGMGKTGSAADGAATALEKLDEAAADVGKSASGGAVAVDALNQKLGKTTTATGGAAGALEKAEEAVAGVGKTATGAVGPVDALSQGIGKTSLAASGMQIAMGAAGALLSGFWGAALAGALTVLVSFVDELFDGADAADEVSNAFGVQKTAAEQLADAMSELDRIAGANNTTAKETAQTALAAADAIYAQVDASRAAIKVKLDAQIKEAEQRNRQSLNPAFANESGINFQASAAGVADGEITDLKKQLAEQDYLVAGARLDQERAKRKGALAVAIDNVKLSTDAAAAAERTYQNTIKNLNSQVLTQAQYENAVTAATTKRRAALDAIKQATKDASKAQSEHNKDLRDAESAAKAAAKAATDFARAQSNARYAVLDQGSKAAVRNIAVNGVPARNDLLDQQVAAIDKGKSSADAFTDQVLTQAVAIGQAIGGSAGEVMRTVAGLAQGANSGNYTGVGGAMGGILTLLSGGKKEEGAAPSKFAEGLKEAVGTPLAGLKDAFKNVFTSESGQAFSKIAGRAAGGAAVGSAVAGIGNAIGIKLDKTGSTVGGAVGSALGPLISTLGPIGAALGPFAGVIGGVLGGLAGSLFGPKGSTTISATAGKVSSSSTGSASVQKATGAIGNTVTDALQSIADQLGATIGDFAVSIGQKKGQYRVDSTGTGKLNGSTVRGVDTEGEALAIAISDALSDGAIKASPRVQAALTAYGDNVNKAVSEALKVKGLEDLLADRNNPFLSAFRTLEAQLKQRVDVARQYGFDLVEIEKLNAEDRAAVLKDTLARATSSIRSLLTDLTIGSASTGSATERLAGLTTERDRLTGLAAGGDTTQGDAIADIIRKIDDLQRETYGSTAGFADGRADNISILQNLMKQAEDRTNAAAAEARGVGEATVAKLTELNGTGDDTVAGIATTNSLLAQIAASLAAGTSNGGGSFSLSAGYARQ